MRRKTKVLTPTALLLLALAACGGGGTSPTPNPPPPPPPPPAPAPVASVAVTPPTSTLVPQQTQALTAATLDASGNPLTGRAVTWSTSAAAVATVSSAGLVTAAGSGNATITATSEGKTGSATILVADGGFVGQTGGTVDAVGGAVHIVLPAGAVTAPVSVTVAPTPGATQPPMPDGVFFVKGTGFTLLPEGTTFAAPVTVTIKYDPTKVPSWIKPSEYKIAHFTGGQWVPLGNQTVDPVAHTVSGTTTSFSPFALGTVIPPVVLSNTSLLVNANQISAVTTATVAGHPASDFKYDWTSTGAHGGAGSTLVGEGQYTMTDPNSPPGYLDVVTVQISGEMDPSQKGVFTPLSKATAEVKRDLVANYEVKPEFNTLVFGQVKSLDAGLKDSKGAPYNPPNGIIRMIWTSSENHGNLDLHNPTHTTDVSRGTYTAKDFANSGALPPRIDQITVDFYIGYVTTTEVTRERYFGPFLVETYKEFVTSGPFFDLKNGSASAFVDIEPKTAKGSFSVRSQLSPGGECITAVAHIPKKAGATAYTLDVTNVHPNPVNNPTQTSTYHNSFTVPLPNPTGALMEVFDAGAFYGLPMDAGCATSVQGIQGRKNLYAGQYASASFKVTTTP